MGASQSGWLCRTPVRADFILGSGSGVCHALFESGSAPGQQDFLGGSVWNWGKRRNSRPIGLGGRSGDGDVLQELLSAVCEDQRREDGDMKYDKHYVHLMHPFFNALRLYKARPGCVVTTQDRVRDSS